MATILLPMVIAAQSIEAFVEQQMATYPKSRLLDIYKSCFQDYMGAEHLVADRNSARAYLEQELATTRLDDLQPWYYEPCGIDHRHVRVSLRAVIERHITVEQLLDAFVASANADQQPAQQQWRDRWHRLVQAIDRMAIDLPHYVDDRMAIDNVLSLGKYAISHSPDYRQAYHPHYRIVERAIFERDLLPLLPAQKP